MCDTPRTDQACRKYGRHSSQWIAFGRELERELKIRADVIKSLEDREVELEQELTKEKNAAMERHTQFIQMQDDLREECKRLQETVDATAGWQARADKAEADLKTAKELLPKKYHAYMQRIEDEAITLLSHRDALNNEVKRRQDLIITLTKQAEDYEARLSQARDQLTEQIGSTRVWEERADDAEQEVGRLQAQLDTERLSRKAEVEGLRECWTRDVRDRDALREWDKKHRQEIGALKRELSVVKAGFDAVKSGLVKRFEGARKELEGKREEFGLVVCRLEDALRDLGVCPKCLEEFEHDVYEPFANCGCCQSEWTGEFPYLFGLKYAIALLVMSFLDGSHYETFNPYTRKEVVFALKTLGLEPKDATDELKKLLRRPEDEG